MAPSSPSTAAADLSPAPEYAAQARLEAIGVWLAIISALGYSFKAILVKLAYPYGVDAVTLLTVRMLFALPLFLWFGWRAPRPAAAAPLGRRGWALLLVLGLVGFYGAAMLDFVGLHYITAGLERLILFAYPTFTVIIGVIVYGRGWRRNEVAALVLTYMGIALAVAHDLEISREGGHVVLGCLAVLASTLCYAVYLAASANLIERLGSARFAAAVTTVATLATFCHFALTHPLADLWQPAPVLWLALAMALPCTVLPVLTLAAAIRRIGSSRAALVGTLGPILTIGLGWLILTEPVSIWQLSGAGLVILGVRLAARH